jgi:hypothetical protein
MLRNVPTSKVLSCINMYRFPKIKFSHFLCSPQSDHAERSDLAKRFFIASRQGASLMGERENREREREREREGHGLKYPSVRLGMI